MTKRMLPFMLLFIGFFISACGLVPYFMYVTPFSIDGCTITVVVPGTRLENYEMKYFIFMDHLSPPLPRRLEDLYDVEEGDDIQIGRQEMVYFEGKFNVDQVIFNSGKWYFNILADGQREVVHIQGFADAIVGQYKKSITDNGWLWVDGDYVENFEAPFLTCGETGEVINVQDPADASVNRLFLCVVDLQAPPVPGRVGPGENRAIRALIPQNRSGYNVHGRATDDKGELWYVLDVPEYGFLWVPKSQTITSIHILEDPLSGRRYNRTCGESNLPHFPAPPLTPEETVVSNESASSCEDFSLISPRDVVPTGIITFEWTTIPDAVEYQILFYNYANQFVTQLNSTTNSIIVNTGILPTGSEFTWEVYAILSDGTACHSNRSDTVIRQAYENAAETEEPDVSDDDDDDGKRRGGGGYTPPDEGDDGEEGDPPPDEDDGYTPPDGDGDPPPDEG